jgi:hypothetical protein
MRSWEKLEEECGIFSIDILTRYFFSFLCAGETYQPTNLPTYQPIYQPLPLDN